MRVRFAVYGVMVYAITWSATTFTLNLNEWSVVPPNWNQIAVANKNNVVDRSASFGIVINLTFLGKEIVSKAKLLAGSLGLFSVSSAIFWSSRFPFGS